MGIVQRTDIVSPKTMARQAVQTRQQRRHGGGVAWRIRLSRMANFVRVIVTHMGRIDQCNQHICIQQKRRHTPSSRSWFTNSDVTGVASGRHGSSGMPLRMSVALADGERCSACRASVEIAAPTLMRCRAAIPLAATSTSSSIASVVRLHPRIGHHASWGVGGRVSIGFASGATRFRKNHRVRGPG
jgi:hypothetical protein